jgi:asparagine N-glycosylation enzyme membrane subunit Stt3
MENPETTMATAKTYIRSSIFDLRSSIRIDWLIHGAVALVFSGALLAYIQFAGPNMVDYDGYYHIKMAQLIREHGLTVPFPWLKFTVIDEAGYTDHHLLMHVFQIPFTWVGDLRLAAKLAPVAFAAVTFTVFYLVIWRYGIRYPLLWLVMLFASSSPFLYRMSMPRGQSLSLALQFIAFHFIMTRNAVGLAILSAFFVLAYNSFPILVPLVLFGVATHYITERKIEYKLILALGVGIVAGLVLHPYFPRNVMFMWNHIVPKLFATDYQTSVGSEWYPYNSWLFLTLSLVAVLSYLTSIFITNRDDWTKDKPRLFWLLASTMYFFLLFKSRRFVEYFPPTAILLLAFSMRDFLKNLDFPRLLKNEVRVAGLVVAMLLLGVACQRSVSAVREDIAGRPPSEAYKGGAEWLAQNTLAGSTVFHTDWDDFPMLFFYNTHNTYLVGLDPDFMRLKDERLFRRWEAITRGKVKRPEGEILKTFGCQYVITDNKHDDFRDIADSSPRMKKVFSDKFTTVYRVLESSTADTPDPETGAAKPDANDQPSSGLAQ